MSNLFVFLLLLSFAGLVAGLIKPSLAIKWGQQRNRKAVFKTYGIALIAFFVLTGVTGSPTENMQEPQSNIQSESDHSSNISINTEDSSDETIASSDEDTNVETEENSSKDNTNTEEEINEDKDNESNKPVESKGDLKAHFINVGQGDSTLIQTPSGKNILIDAGDLDKGDEVISYLNSKGVNTIDVLIFTHPHADHIGGGDDVVRSFNIKDVYMPKVSHTTKSFENLLLEIQKKGLKVKTAKAGVTLNIDSNINAKFVAPNSNSYDDLNDYSAVLRISYGNSSFLITGDAEKISENEIILKGYNLKADVLQIGHHGSESSTSINFLKAVSPKYGVIPVGANNDYGHPHSEVLDRLTNQGVKIYRTDIHGNIVISTDGKSYDINVNEPYNHTPSKNSGSTNTQKPKPTPTPSPKPKPEPTPQPKPAEDIKVSATVDNPNPTQNSTINLIVSGPVGGKVSATAKYKSTNTDFEGSIGSNGTATIPIRIGRASKGFKVNINVTVNYNGKTYTTQTSFTPQ